MSLSRNKSAEGEPEKFIQLLSELLENLKYDSARETLEKEREATKSIAQTGWTKLINVCSLLIVAEKQYMSLMFYSVKSFLRKDTSARTFYESIRAECMASTNVRIEDASYRPFHSCYKRLTQFAGSRLCLIDIYEQLHACGANKSMHPSDSFFQQLKTLKDPSSLSDVGSLLPLWRLLCCEAATLHALCSTQHELLRGRYTDSLFYLDMAGTQLHTLELRFQLVRSAESRRRLFLRSAHQCPALVDWLRRLHSALLDVFTLCFRPVLLQQLATVQNSCTEVAEDAAQHDDCQLPVSGSSHSSSGDTHGGSDDVHHQQYTFQTPANINSIYDRLLAFQRRHDLWLVAIVGYGGSGAPTDADEDAVAAAMDAAAGGCVFFSQGYQCPQRLRRCQSSSSCDLAPCVMSPVADGALCRLVVWACRSEDQLRLSWGQLVTTLGDMWTAPDESARADAGDVASDGRHTVLIRCRDVPCVRSFYQLMISGRLAAVVVSDGPRSEKDGALVSFLHELVATFRCSKILQLLPCAVK